jgi:hypothetical protein
MGKRRTASQGRLDRTGWVKKAGMMGRASRTGRDRASRKGRHRAGEGGTGQDRTGWVKKGRHGGQG